MAPKSRLSEAALIKPPTTLSSTILISEGAQLIGTHPIHIGDHTVLHPRCRLNSTLGPITIGDYCILNERILLAAPDEKGLVVEDYVVVEMNAVVEARRIGEGTVVEVGVKVGKAADVGKVSDDS
jgi:dynactin-6